MSLEKEMNKNNRNIPKPTSEQVEHYLHNWEKLDNYFAQENAIDKLFVELMPNNQDLSDILLKVAVLNDFYSTSIFSAYAVAKHILELEIDQRLMKGDISLVDDIRRTTIKEGVEKDFYSFATKYCSHHNPKAFPIYDGYVEDVLFYFKKEYGFAKFYKKDLRDYVVFKSTILSFQAFFDLKDYDLKSIDKYLWQLGREFFPKEYGKKDKEP